MSRYGNLICSTCKMYLFLGRAVFKPDGTCSHYAIGQEYRPETYAEYSRVIWKFLADHTGHRIEVLLDEDFDERVDDAAAWHGLGEEDVGGISFRDYLKGWPGWPPDMQKAETPDR